jgi:hypothetical protein
MLSELERLETSFRSSFIEAMLIFEPVVLELFAFAAKLLKEFRSQRRTGDPVYPEHPDFISDMKRGRTFARKCPKAHCSSRDRYRSGQ